MSAEQYLRSPRIIFGETLAQLGEENQNIVAIGADSLSRFQAFAERFPERYIDVGIAEQNMTGIAAGFATCGMVPFISAIGVFVSMRNCQQVRTDICYPQLNVKIVGTDTGIQYGTTGASHHAIEDIAIMRSFPHMTILSPCDGRETAKAIGEAARYVGPVYIRVGSVEATPVIHQEDYCLEIGKAETLREGNDLSIIATGTMVFTAMTAADELYQQGVGTRVINVHTIKPIDKDTIIKASQETGAIITAEEHNIIGGLGSAVAEVVSENAPALMKRIGIRDTFSGCGTPRELAEVYHLTSKDVVEAARNLLHKRNS